MKTIEILKYVAGADLLKVQLGRERELIEERTGKTDLLPLEARWQVAGEIYLMRLRSIPRTALTLFSRYTGVDLVAKVVKRTRNK